MFPNDRDLAQAFRLAYCLHPHQLTAVRIIQEALCGRFAVLNALQRKRHRQRLLRRQADSQPVQTFYKLPFDSKSVLLQASIYAVSTVWERDQEKPKPILPHNVYVPRRDDFLVRYVKLLVAQTMDRPVHYAALGLGCHLYQYRPIHMAHLVLPLYTEDNIRRVNSYLLRWIAERFPTLPLESRPPYGEKKVDANPATQQERDLLYNALELLAPWDIPHLRRTELQAQALYDLFKMESQPGKAGLRLEKKRLHALLDPACAGLELVIRAYLRAYNIENENQTEDENQTMPPDNPYDKLAMPAFPADDGPPTARDDRFHPPPLALEARILMQDAFRRQQQRRWQYHVGLLEVLVDGVERLRFDAREGRCPPFEVPLSASAVEVYGQDDAGALLLAVFPLAELLWTEDSGGLRITHAGGQTFELALVPEHGAAEEAVESCIVQLTYTEAPPPLLARLWEGVTTLWQHAEVQLQRLFIHPWVPTAAMALVLMLVVSNVWLGIFAPTTLSPDKDSAWRGEPAAPTARVLVAFRSTSTEGEIRRLLQDIEGQLVGGPLTGAEEGYYVVDVSLRPTGPTTPEEVLSRLRQIDIIRDVTALPSAP